MTAVNAAYDRYKGAAPSTFAQPRVAREGRPRDLRSSIEEASAAFG
jgi:hypothetical protein